MTAAGSDPAVEVAPARSSLPLPDRRAVALAASAAALVLALSSTGPVVIVAVLVGIAASDVRPGLVVGLAGLAASVRFGTGTLDDLAGIQSVLGPAGTVGPTLAASSAWIAAGAVVVSSTLTPPARTGDRPPGTGRLAGRRWWRPGPAVASGALAAALVAGPGIDDVAVRIGATVGATVLAVAVALLDGPRVRTTRLGLALVGALTAVVLAGWPT